MAQWSRKLILQRTRVQLPQDSSQLPVTPAPEDLTPSCGTCRNHMGMYNTHMHTHTLFFKKKEAFSYIKTMTSNFLN